MEPPPSVPSASVVMPPATAAPAPPDDPPEVYSRFHGFGVTPQSVNAMGGFKAQGRDDEVAESIRADAVAVAAAGAFSIVIEGTVEPLAAALTEELPVPTIGIGASPKCDGQILVIDDILGVFQDFTPRFVKRYADLADQISDAAATYADEVRRGLFPTTEHTFGGKPKPAGTGTGTGG